MAESEVNDETLLADMQFLLECEFESMTLENVTYSKEYPLDSDNGTNFATENLSVLIITSYHEPASSDDWQWVIARYTTPDGQRGFGELCIPGDKDQASLMSMPMDVVMSELTEKGRRHVHFVADGLRSGELVSEE